MLAEDFLRSGDIAAARTELQGRIRAAPGDGRLRVFLFQLLCVTGEWDRALAQLKLCGELEPATTPMVQTYRETIACELLRDKVFRGETTPLVLGTPAPWMALLIEALRVLAAGDPAGAAALRAAAFEAAPPSAGTLDGTPFAWIADADSRLGPVLELIVNGKYAWVPFANLAAITIEPPGDLRDRVWCPVALTWPGGGEGVGFIPTRYPAAPGPGDAERLSRLTRWEERGADTYLGHGQRILVTDAGDHPLLDIRRIAFAGAADG